MMCDVHLVSAAARVGFSALLMLFLITGCRQQEGETKLFSDTPDETVAKGDTISPFSYINPKEKGWKVVIEISGDDLDRLSVRVPGRKLATSKPAVLKRIHDWKFRSTGGDLATVTSTILVYRHGTLVDQQGIVLDEDMVGLQSIRFGWVEPTDRKEIYKTIRLMDEKMF
jgi:hypothetical protein